MLEPWLDPRLKTKFFLKAGKKMGGQRNLNRDCVF